jgi:beta-barrel assembly-enhancing protease
MEIVGKFTSNSVSVLASMIVLGFTACAINPPKPANPIVEPLSAEKTAGLVAEQQRLRLVITSHSKDFGHDFVPLQELIAAPAFGSLSVDDQYEALSLAARKSMFLKHRELANEYIARVVALPGLGFEDQAAALGTAREIGNWSAAVRCLTSIAHQWPERLGNIDSRTVAQVVYGANYLPRNDRFLMLHALYAAHWTLKWGIEPSSNWRDLTILLLERHSLQEAIDVSAHVMQVYVLVAMRADHRFDAVVAAHPAQFDVEAAADRQLKTFQTLSDEHPKSLALKARVMEALLHEQHYAAMLAASDSVMQEIETTNFPDKLFDDYVEEHDTNLYLRSVALQRAGRPDEAVTQLVEAGHEGDINQLINLAFLYCALDRPRDALAVIGPIGPTRTSGYGAMQVEVVRLQAAVQLGDRAQVPRSLAYLSAHRADAPRAYLYALVVAKQADQAARYLITELEDKDLRQGILRDIQEYLPTPGTRTELEIEAQLRSVIARKDVQAAIHKVGRVESYHLESP